MRYEARLEISGPTAMWTRPDTGDAPVSYPAPTFAAVKGIFESIVWLKSAGANVADTGRPVRHCQ
jgi:CRISPR-associated protein Cas5d